MSLSRSLTPPPPSNTRKSQNPTKNTAFSPSKGSSKPVDPKKSLSKDKCETIFFESSQETLNNQKSSEPTSKLYGSANNKAKISISPIKFRPSLDNTHFINNKSVSTIENGLLLSQKDQSSGKVFDKSKNSETYKNNSYRIYNERGAFPMNNDFFSDRDESAHFFLNNNDDEVFIRPGERGLKYISKRAKEIVISLKKTSFGKVAEILISSLSFTRNNDFKEKQNIKRRVYDALNVLIATDVLVKKGKEISVNSRHLSHLRPNYVRAIDSLKVKTTLQMNIQEKVNHLQHKKDKFVEVYSQFFALQLLKQRNFEALEETTELLFKESSKKTAYLQEVLGSFKKKETVDFPFLMIELKNPNDVAIFKDRNKNLEIHSKTGMSVLGDLDVLRKMDLQKKVKKREKIEKMFPREIYQYFPDKMLKEML